MSARPAQPARARATADRSRSVTLSLSQTTLRIHQDDFRFSFTTSRPGYPYLLQAGSDGKTLNVIYPNSIDGNHHVGAGTYAFSCDGSALRLRSRGLAGASHLLAVMVERQLDLSRLGAGGAWGFRASVANTVSFRSFVAESAQAGSGSYGVSRVVQTKEVP